MLLVGPLFGSIADFTSYRKIFGAVAMILTILCTLTNVFISSETLGFVLVCTTIQTVTYLCVYSMYRAAYLPELADTEDAVTRLSAKGYIILFISQIGFLGTLVTAANVIAGEDTFLYMKSAAGIVVALGIILAFIVIKNMGYRPAVSKLEAGQNICTIGFITIYKSFKDMALNYTQLRRFMIFTSFANPAFNAAPALAVTYMSALGLSVNEVTLALGLTILVGICGPLVVTYAQRKYNISIQRIMLFVVTFYMVVVIIFPILAPLGYIFIILVAMGIGLASGMWLAAGQAFFATLCPGGKEATFTGCYMFANKSMDWIPALVFSVINQATNNLLLSYYCSVIIFDVGAVILCYTIDMEKGRDEIKHTLKDRRLSLSGGNDKENGLGDLDDNEKQGNKIATEELGDASVISRVEKV